MKKIILICITMIASSAYAYAGDYICKYNEKKLGYSGTIGSQITINGASSSSQAEKYVRNNVDGAKNVSCRRK
jgi:hypothetical protein